MKNATFFFPQRVSCPSVHITFPGAPCGRFFTDGASCRTRSHLNTGLIYRLASNSMRSERQRWLSPSHRHGESRTVTAPMPNAWSALRQRRRLFGLKAGVQVQHCAACTGVLPLSA